MALIMFQGNADQISVSLVPVLGRISSWLQSDVQAYPDPHAEADQARHAVAHKGKRDTGVGEQAGRNAYIQKTLEKNQCSHAAADQGTCFLLCPEADPDAHDCNQNLKEYDGDTADKAEFFSRDCEDEVRLRLGNKVTVLYGINRIVVQPFSIELTGSDRDDRILLLGGVLFSVNSEGRSQAMMRFL